MIDAPAHRESKLEFDAVRRPTERMISPQDDVERKLPDEPPDTEKAEHPGDLFA